MLAKGLIDYDIVNYKEAAMFIEFPRCSFKCDKECGQSVCQNSKLALEPDIELAIPRVIDLYLENALTHAVVLGGLEPFDSRTDLFNFINSFRAASKDPIIIYTGYTEDELSKEIPILKKYFNIIIKFGRFIPNRPSRYDEVLGVTLASDNQYAKKL